MIRQMTAIIEREGDSYVALCPELDIASQGAATTQDSGSAYSRRRPTSAYGRYHHLRDVARQAFDAPRPLDSCRVGAEEGVPAPYWS